MKIFHTADWHLGNTLYDYDREKEQAHFLNWLIDKISIDKPNALLITGDVLDRYQTDSKAEKLLYDFFVKAHQANPDMQTIITSGDSDSVSMLEAAKTFCNHFGVTICSELEYDAKGKLQNNNFIIPLQGKNDNDKAMVIALPFIWLNDANQEMTLSDAYSSLINSLTNVVQKEYGNNIPLILMAHCYVKGAEMTPNDQSEHIIYGNQECVDIKNIALNNINYVALGHIHKSQSILGGRIQYAGCPLPMSFEDDERKYGINVLTSNGGGEITTEFLEYKPYCKMISIPEKGIVVSEADVMKILKQLPDKSKDDLGYNYLEIKIHEHNPNNKTIDEIKNILEEKNVRLCRIIRVRENGVPTKESPLATILTQLKESKPFEIANKIYRRQKGENMPDEVAKLFTKAKTKACSTPNF